MIATLPYVSPSAVDALEATVEELASEAVETFSDGALADDLIRISRCLERLNAQFCRRLYRFDKQHGYVSDNSTSSVSWLRQHCRMSANAARQRVDVARALPDLPETEARFSAGEITFQHAAVISRCAEYIGVEQSQEFEHELLEASSRCDAVALARYTRHLRHVVNPDGANTEWNDKYDRRFVQLSQTYDDVWILNGLLDPEGGAALQTVLDALMEKTPESLTSRASQRRADALVELSVRAMQSGSLPEVAGVRPHLTVTVSDATLRRDPATPGGNIEWSGPIVAEAVRRLACDASRKTLYLDANGTPHDAGRTSRTIPPALRRMLVARDGGCRFPGCNRPPQWTDGHHIKHWADGGETNLNNLVLLCRRHHRAVHEQGMPLDVEQQDASGRGP